MAGLDDLITALTGAAGTAAATASGAASTAAGMASGAAGMATGAASSAAGALDPAKLAALAGPLVALIGERGGLSSVLGQLQDSPIGAQVSSWIGGGPNEPVSAEQEADAAPEAVQELAQETGMSAEEVSSGLSQLLPGLINSLTPGGAVPGADQLGAIVGSLPGGDTLKGVLGGLLGGSSS